MTNPVFEALLVIGQRELVLSRGEIVASLSDPEWLDADQTHDWRTYVSPDMRALWGQLSDESRALAFVVASEQEHNSIWD